MLPGRRRGAQLHRNLRFGCPQFGVSLWLSQHWIDGHEALLLIQIQ